MNGFAAGTLVHTENGLVPIEQIKVGDNVLSKAADGSGDLVYKPVKQTIITDNAPIYMMMFDLYFDPSILPHEKINMELEMSDEELQVPAPLFLTNNHPFWTRARGWTRADELATTDVLVTKDNRNYVPYRNSSSGYKCIEKMYHANKEGYVYAVNLGDDTGDIQGSYINMSTGKFDFYGEPPAWTSKLWHGFDDWEQNLLEQTPEEQREHVDFHGFRKGYMESPETFNWGEGEGPLTMTVYNLEVEDTHTYFVGEAGIWVHNCGGEEDCVGYRGMWRTRQTRVNKTKKEKEL